MIPVKIRLRDTPNYLDARCVWNELQPHHVELYKLKGITTMENDGGFTADIEYPEGSRDWTVVESLSLGIPLFEAATDFPPLTTTASTANLIWRRGWIPDGAAFKLGQQ